MSESSSSSYESAQGEEEEWTQAAAEQEEHRPLTAEERLRLEREGKGLFEHGCPHYRRRCQLVAPCCGGVFWCRHCHNVEKHDNEQDPAKMHTLNRSEVKELVCALCNTRQPAARTCTQCGVAFGQYACLECNFFDDDVNKRQFHCSACGLCRVGGRENYFHCNTCNCCYSIQLQESHRCVENSMHNNCAVCFEYLFDSVKPICVLPCGHTIHQECLQELQLHSIFVCPSCNKTYLSESSMERIWASMEAAIRDTPMPPEYANMQVNILCNNCHARSRVPFHVVGHQCSQCGGFNTQRI